MARKSNKKEPLLKNPLGGVPTETKKGVFAIVLFIVGLFLVLAAFGIAGSAGSDAYRLFNYLLGIGYFLLPLLFFVLAGNALRSEIAAFTPLKIISSIIFIIAGLGFITIVGDGGGIVGSSIAGPLIDMFDVYATVIILGGLALISLLLLLEGGIPTATISAIGRLVKKPFTKKTGGDAHEPIITGAPEDEEEDGAEDTAEPVTRPIAAAAAPRTAPQPDKAAKKESNAASLALLLGKYTPPPVSLLEKDRGRPGVGDIKANANLIKRTLQNFGIVVELDEISIGPSVTRYAIKPAEGVRLQKILGLQNNLELALAAHPVRIEAPIPGKSLVGIEVPNSAKVTVGLGTLLDSKEFTESQKPLLIAMGRDIAGGSQFGNIAKMPHLLIAGATGSGKSVAIHGLVNSLIYRMGPAQLRFIMIDPKRVELTLYRSLPHLLTPVITDAKKAIAALRWAGKEMDRRYNILEEHRVRDIGSYHENILAPTLEKLRKNGGPGEGEEVPEGMPYIVIILDELADIMQSFPRELEGAIVRLAQMSRAVGIHLVLSTQRPSVNVITGLIKANVPSRVALQVASQFDSRTILDQGGAENLLGSGDMLYMSAEMGKPIRLQNAYISEKEVKAVVDFIAQNNEAELPIEIGGTPSDSSGGGSSSSSSGGFGGDEEEVDDDMYEAARSAVKEAGKASTSYIQRKLRVGYARAARLMDILEERGVIGPADGAKPRDVLEKTEADGGGNQGEV
ncbi:MAG: DNA translocase FtsK [Candidatus Pacebacteria bacterium]|nr:DNA translocase FtsK [Candidatus Paceibacterota bacterium]